MGHHAQGRPPPSPWRVAPGSRELPLIIAHRGASALAPENTLAAFRLACELGADGVEVDVRPARDRHVVVLHDRTVDRTTPLKGPTLKFTQAELCQQDAGSWFSPRFSGERVPTLDQVFQALPPDYLIYIDLKVQWRGLGTVVPRIVQAIRRHQRWESTLVSSFNSLAMALLHLIEPRITRGLTWSKNHPLPMRQRWLSPLVRPLWLTPDRGTFSSQVLQRAHKGGHPVLAWDLDAGRDLQKLGEMRLDGVLTDAPHLLVAKEARGKKAGD